MVKRGIIFGSFFACILMLLVPSISAIEFKTVLENIADYNENEQIDALKERIEQLKIQNPNPKLTLNGDNPDGPFKGGLDDTRDWVDLFFGIFFGQGLARFFKYQALKKILATGDLYNITIVISTFYIITHSTITRLGDAFDTIDPDKDGY